MAPFNRFDWDEHSAIRERLFLLAALGPDLDPTAWRYYPRSDVWRESLERTLAVSLDSRGSLAAIAKRWNLSRAEAMDFIGYPELNP